MSNLKMTDKDIFIAGYLAGLNEAEYDMADECDRDTYRDRGGDAFKYFLEDQGEAE